MEVCAHTKPAPWPIQPDLTEAPELWRDIIMLVPFWRDFPAIDGATMTALGSEGEGLTLNQISAGYDWATTGDGIGFDFANASEMRTSGDLIGGRSKLSGLAVTYLDTLANRGSFYGRWLTPDLQIVWRMETEGVVNCTIGAATEAGFTTTLTLNTGRDLGSRNVTSFRWGDDRLTQHINGEQDPGSGTSSGTIDTGSYQGISADESSNRKLDGIMSLFILWGAAIEDEVLLALHNDPYILIRRRDDTPVYAGVTQPPGISIERSDDGVSGWTEIDQVALGVEIYNDPQPQGTTKWYRVREFNTNTGSTSDYSNIDSAAAT